MRLSLILSLVLLVAVAAGQTDLDTYRDNLIRQRDLYYSQLIEETQASNEAFIRQLETARLGLFGTMAANARLAEAVLELSGYPLEKRSRVRLRLNPIDDSIDIAPYRLAKAQFAISALISDTIRKNTAQISQLEEQRRDTRAIDESIKKILQKQSQQEPPPSPRGMVKGIVYSDKPSALIGSEIVHVGTMIDDIEVIDIRPDSVIFGIDSQTWEQQVGQQPPYQW